MKTVVLLGICAGLLCCGAADGKFADIPVLSCSGSPCVDARLDGGALIRLVLDFPNFTSYVSTAAAKKQSGESSRRVQLGQVVLTDRFPVVIPRSKKSMDQWLMNRFPGDDGGLSLHAFAGSLLVLDLPHRLDFVTLAGATVCSSASLVRYNKRFGGSAMKHEATIGLGILSKFPIALDFRNKTMWIFESDAKPVNCD